MDLSSLSRAAIRAASSLAARPTWHQARFRSQQQLLWQSQSRAFSSPSIRYSPATATAQQPSTTVQSPTIENASPSRDQGSLDAKDEYLLNAALDNDAQAGIAAKHKHHHHAPEAEASSSSTYAAMPEEPPQTSADDVRSALEKYNRSKAAAQQEQEIMFPKHGAGAAQTQVNAAVLPPPPRISNTPYMSLHITTRTGKSMAVNPGSATELGSKIRALEAMSRANRIKLDFARQRFHERGGLKRKRLHSERWRRRFKSGFLKVVGRVQELRKKGW